MINLSENFSLNSFIKSNTALKKGINNTMPDRLFPHAVSLAQDVLQPARKHFNAPIVVSSGYRCPELCVAIGSFLTSDHTKGGCADIEFLNHDIPLIDLGIWIAENVPFTKIIFEYMPHGWHHVYYDMDNLEGKILVKDKKHDYIRKTLDEIKKMYGVG